MKLLQIKKDTQLTLGIKVDEGILDVVAASERLQLTVPRDVQQVIESGVHGLEALHNLYDQVREQCLNDLFLEENNVEFGPVVSNPEKILCVGLNYASHANETKGEPPAYPLVFSKFNNTLAGHKRAIKLPESSKQVDYEAELVIVIGKTAHNVSEVEALDYVFGYTAGNDLSARDLQFRTGQWLIGKTCDEFAPIGPYLVTTDEMNDPSNLDIGCMVNGIVRQEANTKNMIFDCMTIVSYISKHMTLKPGDIIFTGTPDGVILGYPKSERKWLKAGDSMEVYIERIGTLSNTLI